jgi:hypothetical protein
VGGVIAATLIASATKLARSPNGRISDAVVSSTKDALSSLVASGVFSKTIATAKSAGLEKMYAYGSTLAVSDERDAFAKAATLAIAQVSQEKSIDELKSRFPDAVAVIDLAVSYQASPLDVANAIGGETEKLAMDQALSRNAGGDGEPSDSGTSVGEIVAVASGLGLLGYLAFFL